MNPTGLWLEKRKKKPKKPNEIHSDAPVPMMASAISSYLMGLAQTWLSHPESYSLAEQADTLVDCFFKGYLPTSITSTSDNAP
ncbi:hypothetical protein OLMES_4099 [Oleiphilus messinensis]|uniref:Transcription regulator MAATS C-terminal domain-containing protein n=2 Tax=Oleiphilus messinensis TaxID=141451 RepID=A0A1Y0IEA6_9GAMM|nr:hypothetical protein OLMES_4099 [Oleiphilus messinensis]